MNDVKLINTEDAVEKLRKLIELPIEMRVAAISAVRSVAPVEAEIVKHGRWISFLNGDSIMPKRYYTCSCCGRVECREESYCHCGAKMDLDER